jgi:hypothetical protein
MILRVPNGAWRPDTVVTDWEGNEIFVLLDQTNTMSSYEAVFGDLEGRRLCCVKRHLLKAFWKDGYYFCTYRPNYPGQKHLEERDVDNKRLYPFSYLQCVPLKGRFFYRVFDRYGTLDPPRMRSQNPWLGFMSVCCTPLIRFGRWTMDFKRISMNGRAKPLVRVDQWKNTVTVSAGQDILAALCMAYVFDRLQCQPMVTVFGKEEDDLMPDDASYASSDDSDAPYENSGNGLSESRPKLQKDLRKNDEREDDYADEEENEGLGGDDHGDDPRARTTEEDDNDEPDRPDEEGDATNSTKGIIKTDERKKRRIWNLRGRKTNPNSHADFAETTEDQGSSSNRPSRNGLDDIQQTPDRQHDTLDNGTEYDDFFGVQPATSSSSSASVASRHSQHSRTSPEIL